MTEQQGLFTVMTNLYLTTEQRAQIEHIVHEQRIDLADLVSQIVADHPPEGRPPAFDHQHLHIVPTRIYLTPEQRVEFARLARERRIDLADLVSQSVTGYLDQLPPVPFPVERKPDYSAELRKLRGDLARLRARRQTAGKNAPAWLDSYIAEVEADIQRLEQLI
jgi:hypothetical protein